MGGHAPSGPTPPPPASLSTPTAPQESAPVQQKVAGARFIERGRRTLPVDLVPTPGGGPLVTFTGFGETELVIGLTKQTSQVSRWILGFILIAAFGTTLSRRTAKSKVILIVFVLTVTSLLALWQPATTDLANGAFTAGVALILLYVFIALVRCLWNSLFVQRALI
jgi:hypothetical protein